MTATHTPSPVLARIVATGPVLRSVCAICHVALKRRPEEFGWSYTPAQPKRSR